MKLPKIVKIILSPPYHMAAGAKRHKVCCESAMICSSTQLGEEVEVKVEGTNLSGELIFLWHSQVQVEYLQHRSSPVLDDGSGEVSASDSRRFRL
jgi:hypothetical protein